jgi:endogenous inhibitor of DNA gyrase (YacG/DUF329 family)
VAGNPFGSKRGKCPICGRPSEPDYRPFCSRRCADVDLARWLGGAYAIPDRGDSEERAADANDGAKNGEAGPDHPQ